jgi:hypothetical protein
MFLNLVQVFLRAMLHASDLDGGAFDAVALQRDGLTVPNADVGRAAGDAARADVAQQPRPLTDVYARVVSSFRPMAGAAVRSLAFMN